MNKTFLTSFTVLCLLSTVFLMGLSFNIQTVKASETIHIRADGSIDPPTPDITSADNVTYTLNGNIDYSIVVERSNITVDGKRYTVEGYEMGEGFRLASVNNVTVKNLTIKGFHRGIYLSGSWSNTFCGNNITANNYYGIYLSESSSNTVSGNNITANNIHGIYLSGSWSNTFCGNDIAANNIHGISLYGSWSNTVSGNDIAANNIHGIYLSGSSSNTFSENNIIANNDDGISLYGSWNYNTFSGNNIIANNDDGISLYGSWNYNTFSGNNIIANNDDGISLYGSLSNTFSGNNITGNNDDGISLYGSSDNLFYHNNFIDNTRQVNITGPDYANFWDNGFPSGGNYWSDYNGTDGKLDGTGDTLYNIGANNTDRYPLMGMFHSFNTSLGYDVNVISNSAIEDFQYFKSISTIKMHVSNMTSNQTHGFCRLCMPHILMSEPYYVTIDGAEPYYVNYTLYDDGDNRWIYFAYEHSTLEIVIIPEFPSFLILPLFMIMTLLAVIVYRRKHSR